jgi:hypothetical protein
MRPNHDGNPGSDGRHGRDGSNGRHGIDGKDGIITFQVYNDQLQLVEQSNTMYEPVLINFEMIPDVDDSILEPNEKVYFQSFQIENRGGLSIPEGSLISISTNGFDCFDGIVLPKIPPSSFFSPKDVLVASVKDFKNQNLEIPLNLSLEVKFRIHVSNIILSTCMKVYECQYPIKIGANNSVTQLNLGSIGKIQFIIDNISSFCYGNDETGISYKVTLSDHLHFEKGGETHLEYLFDVPALTGDIVEKSVYLDEFTELFQKSVIYFMNNATVLVY